MKPTRISQPNQPLKKSPLSKSWRGAGGEDEKTPATQPATLHQTGNWIECRCPTTNRLMFKINLHTLRIERRERKRTVYVDLRELTANDSN